MKKQISIFVALLFCLILGSTVMAQEPDRDDFQVWNETKVYFGAIKKTDKSGKEQKIISPHFIGMIRFGDNVSRVITTRVGFGADIRINKYAKFTPSYIYVPSTNRAGRTFYEHRARFDLTLANKWGNFGVANRNRFERRIRHSRSDRSRYRNRTKLSYSIKNSAKKTVVEPFMMVEPNYSTTNNELTRVDTTLGVKRKLTDKISSDYFYTLRNNLNSTQRHQHIFGVNLKITLD